MNLRNVGEYNIGLDIGTGSVGWAVTDSEGNLCYFKGKPTWGSRIFPSALPASEARVHRGLRRRYSRRRWRLDLLQRIFDEEMDAVDPEFFIRLKQSALLLEDRTTESSDALYALFNDDGFTEKDYFEKFPTIYHLRKWLMETDEKADIRLIYLALHNIVKYRGNFLQQDKVDLTSENANVSAAVNEFCMTLQEYCDEMGIACDACENEEEITEGLGDTQLTRSQVAERVQKLLGLREGDGALDKVATKKMAKALATAVVGLSSEMADVFFAGEEKPAEPKTKIYLSKDEEADAFQESCPDNGLPLFEAMRKVYSSYVLQEILSSSPGCTLSANKVADFERYGEDLKLLKDLFREYAPEMFDEFFRGEFYSATELHPQKHIYDKSKAKGYTKYNVDHSWPYAEFRKSVEKALEKTAAVNDPRYANMRDEFRAERFLRRLKTSDNGAIPFQLHLEEMRKIIAGQQQYYPFLEKEKEKLESLVSFRIPYYVGPLTTKNARKDAKENLRFAWAERLEGKEDEPVKPWNWEEVIDKDKSATAFIRRMTGTCSYLLGQPVLPKSSLLYEEFCVLNELNGAKFTQDGDAWHRLDYADRDGMVKDLFRKGKVSYKKAAEWMKRERCHANVHVRGGQGETGFESKLGSYAFFAQKVFNVEEIPESDYPMVEEIILWSTLFEDRDIFKEKLKRKYGERLTPEQIGKIVRKRFTGWGRLSEKLLTQLKAETDNGPKSIMDVLREGNPNNSGPSRAMVLMEVLHDDSLGFDKLIADENKQRVVDAKGLALDELPGSPALRRGVNQALGIVEEISKIAGHAPNNIFIEVTREDDPKKRGQRTRKRYDKLKEATEKLKSEAIEFLNPESEAELANYAARNESLDERLTLYFMQGGKSLYSGLPLDIGRLSEYEVDHILPRSYIKDDSFENKALVLKSENQGKSDQMLLDPDMQKKMKPYWDALLQAGLIGKKKHASLLRDGVSENQMKGFIARQLVETSQILKTVQMLLEERNPDSKILPVKAGLSHELRDKLGLVKCREINDFHHAHDALLAAEIGRFVQKRHPGMYENPIGYTKVLRDFVKNEGARVRRGGAPGTAPFVIASFLSSGFDEETGELFKDDWSAERECAKLRRYFNYRQCYISRMPEETSGAFWTETVYSPRGGKKTPSIPLKKGLDPMKYGGYSGLNPAYFVLIAAHDSKGRDKRLFEGVPIADAVQIKEGSQTVEEWSSGLAESRGLVFDGVMRSRMLKYSRINHDGNEYYVSALDCVYSSRELVLNENLNRIADAVCNQVQVPDGEISQDGLMLLYQSLMEKSLMLCARFKPVRDQLVSGADAFELLPTPDKRQLLKNVLNFFNGTTARVDLKLIGGSSNAGKITNGFITNPNEVIEIVDQSITGMFERRTHIGL